MWFKHPFFKYATGVALVLFIIYLLGKNQFAILPVLDFIRILLFPLLIAGFLFYILKPVVRLLTKFNFISRTLAILIVFSIMIGAIMFGGMTLGVTVDEQFSQFLEKIPTFIEENEKQTKQIIQDNNFGLFSYEQAKQKLLTYIINLGQHVGENATKILSSITNVIAVMLTVPFVLFYLLKDGHRLLPFLLNFIPEKHEEEGKKILTDIDETLSTYIGGQMLIAFVNGILMYIGYLIIGLEYAFMLAVIVVITAVIPIIGPALGILPAILLALVTDPFLIIGILILLIIVQQLEGNFISPLIIGTKLSIHPLTVILLLLSAGVIYGFIGILLAVPVYSVLKVIVKNLYLFYRLRI
ncbi:AI-2E family transporter [Bacillus sp. HMF5848]|uniref:AI-2E family transporter n=1 Tax=Bacillus sp. HMF5848 TaxID=2495421 RepID=UPI000F7974D9|nr:AI-2E family transporter [Bacillus sp. HMF5848]RSK25833.1 AI-2E family transporter [Bacillus sp. HMF5848]